MNASSLVFHAERGAIRWGMVLTTATDLISTEINSMMRQDGYFYCLVSFLPCCTAKLQFQGRQWIDSVRPCLMREIRRSNLYSSPTGGDSDCDNLRILAFNSHPTCYVRHGFCSIVTSLSNLNGLFFALQFGRDFVGPYWRESWAQVLL